jgi:hypothetical protein
LLACTATFLFALVSTRGARAADDEVRQHTATPTANAESTRWYGWQTLIVDGSAVGLMAIGGSYGVALGVTAYAFGGPMVHGVHGRSGVALGDFLLRVGAPLVAGAMGYGIGAGNPSQCSPDRLWCDRDAPALEGAAVGVLAGAGLAVLLDAALIARETVPSDAPESTGSATVRWSPRMAVTPRGEPNLGVGGSF